jgi:hypothetical protein
VALYIFIRETSVSNLEGDTGYSDWRFSLFSSVSEIKYQRVLRSRQDRFLPNPFQFLNRQLFYHQRYIFWDTDCSYGPAQQQHLSNAYCYNLIRIISVTTKAVIFLPLLATEASTAVTSHHHSIWSWSKWIQREDINENV